MAYYTAQQVAGYPGYANAAVEANAQLQQYAQQQMLQQQMLQQQQIQLQQQQLQQQMQMQGTPGYAQMQSQQAHGAEQLQTQAIQQAASKLIVSGCQNETVAGIVRGEYVAASENHGRPVFRRTEQSNNMDVLIYFWDDRDGASFSGWWFGPAVGGDQVWAYSPDKSMVPPSSQWRVPYDGPVDASFSVQVVGSQEQQAYQQMAQQNQYQQAQQGYTQGCGPCGQAGFQQNMGHQEWQEAQRRQQEEQNAIQMVRQAIHRVRTTSPEALDQACAEMQDVFNKVGGECGNTWQRLQQEVYQATQMAAERKETYRQQREEEEKRMKEREAVTAQLLQELSQLVIAAEGSVSELKEKVQPIMDTSLDLSELDKSSAGFDEVKGKAKASCRACSDFLLSKRFAMEEARSVVAETREQLVQLQRKIHGAFVNMATCVNGLEAKIDGAHRKEKALKHMEKREELFRKYDVDNDGMLNAQEIAAYAQGEYSFQVPQSVIDKLVGSGDDRRGVDKQNLARVRQAVGVAREEAAVKRRRVEAEKRRRELEAEKEALEAKLEAASKYVEESVGIVEEVELAAKELTDESGVSKPGPEKAETLLETAKGKLAAIKEHLGSLESGCSEELKSTLQVGLGPCQVKVKDFQERLSRLSHTVAQHKLSVEATKEETTSKTQEGGEGGASEGTDTQNGGTAAPTTAPPAPPAANALTAGPAAAPPAPPEMASVPQPAAAVGHEVQKENSPMQIDEPAQAGKPQEACAAPEGDKSGA